HRRGTVPRSPDRGGLPRPLLRTAGAPVSPSPAGGAQITIRPLRRTLSNAAAYLPLCGRARRPLGSTAAVSQAKGTEQARAHKAHFVAGHVMRKDHRGRVVHERLAQHLAWVDAGTVDRAA